MYALNKSAEEEITLIVTIILLKSEIEYWVKIEIEILR